MSAQYNISYVKSGYTLIEILVGLVIISLLFSFGYASFRDFSRRESLNGTIKKIQGDIRLAQGLASAGEKPASALCASPNLLDSYALRIVSSTEYRLEAQCSAGNVIYKDVIMPAEITISTPSPNPIWFKVLGQGTNITDGNSAILTLTQKGTNSTATITITSGGEIK